MIARWDEAHARLASASWPYRHVCMEAWALVVANGAHLRLPADVAARCNKCVSAPLEPIPEGCREEGMLQAALAANPQRAKDLLRERAVE